nr:prephenate dehydrogenase/arogenate dehydrogenase family protein [Stackebrandtia nassauensis]
MGAQQETGKVRSSESMDIGVVGLGLIGGSLLRRAHAAGFRVSGFDADAATREAARQAGYEVADALAGLADARLLVLAVPLPALATVLPELSGYGGLLTDVTSVKEPVTRLVARHCPSVRFVAGHPMAGKETSGFAAADADLFEGRVWVACLDEDTDLDDWLRLAETACALGARVVPATVAEHDTAAARISHVPHVLAAALSLLAADPLSRALGAGSFADGTRVAQSSPELAAAMCAGNAGPVAAELRRLVEELAEAGNRLGDHDAFRDWYAGARELRVDWPPEPGDVRRLPVTTEDLLSLGRAGGWVTEVDRGTRSVMVRQPQVSVA